MTEEVAEPNKPQSFIEQFMMKTFKRIWACNNAKCPNAGLPHLLVLDGMDGEKGPVYLFFNKSSIYTYLTTPIQQFVP